MSKRWTEKRGCEVVRRWRRSGQSMAELPGERATTSNECGTGGSALSGHVFIFLNRRRNQVKVLIWTRGGFTIVHERLERGTFAFARGLSGAKCVPSDVHELGTLLEGIDMAQGRMTGDPHLLNAVASEAGL